MRSITFLALLSIAAAIPVPHPQSDSGFENGQLSEAPNNQQITPSPPAVEASGGGNDGGFNNGSPIKDIVNNSPVTRLPDAPVDPENGGNDGGFVDNGVPVDANAPASGSSSIFGTFKKPATTTTRSATSGIPVTPENIIAISSDAASCPTSGEFASECRTAEQAAPFVSDSFAKHGINNKAEAAAVLSLMLFESGGLKYNIHHFPGPNPGQGTRNMMNFPFILEYAKEVLPESEKGDLPATVDGVEDTKKDEILGKVLGDEFSFGSAAWFYQKKCDDETKKAVQSGSEDGWKQYLEKCVGTSVEGRQEGWNKAKQALGA